MTISSFDVRFSGALRTLGAIIIKLSEIVKQKCPWREMWD